MAVAVAEFQLLLAQLADELGSRIDRLVPNLTRLSQPELLSFITDAYPELVTPYIAAGNDLTTVWYDEQPTAAESKSFYAEPAAVAPIDQLAISARWAMLQADPAGALKGTATRAVFTGSRDTVIMNTTREDIRWARHASANACGFCRMLATRGAVYRSQALAKKSHDGCHCLAVPDRDGLYVPAPYVEQWDRDYTQARKDGARTPGQIANAMDKADGGRRAPTPAKMPKKAAPSTQSSGTVPPVKPPDKPRLASGGESQPPDRIVGMLGPDTGDEFPVFSGWRAPVKRSEIERFTEEDALFVLDGDGTGGHGYHRSGLGVKSDEFPAGWESQDVVDLANAIVDAPTDGMKGRAEGSFSLLGVHRDVVAVVRLRDDPGSGWRIATVHPYDAVRWQRERERLGN